MSGSIEGNISLIPATADKVGSGGKMWFDDTNGIDHSVRILGSRYP